MSSSLFVFLLYQHSGSKQPYSKKTKVKLDLLTDIDILLMVKKGFGGEVCHDFHLYAKANNKYVKKHDKNKESSYLKYWDENKSYGWEISQKLAVNDFKLFEETSKFNEDFKES